MINLMMWTLISLIVVVLVSHAWNTQDAIDNKKYINEYDLIIADSIENHQRTSDRESYVLQDNDNSEVNNDVFITIDNSIKFSKVQKSKLELYPVANNDNNEIEIIVA